MVLAAHVKRFHKLTIIHFIATFLRPTIKQQVNGPIRIASKALFMYPMSIRPFYTKPTLKRDSMPLQGYSKMTKTDVIQKTTRKCVVRQL